MANPPLHTRFKPGQSGNPSGSRKRLLTKDSYAAIGEKYLGLPTADLRKLSSDESIPAIHRMVITQILAAIDKNQIADNLMGYCIGKAAEVLQADVTTTEKADGLPVEVLLKAVNDRRG